MVTPKQETQDVIKVVDGRLMVDVGLADLKSAPLSGSGKNRVLFSTRGNQRVDGTDVVLGLNVYTRA